MIKLLKKYWRFTVMGLHEAFTYRAMLIIWILQSLVWLAVIPFVWIVVYGERDSVAGYSTQLLVSYFFYIPIIETLVVSFVYDPIQSDIKEGNIAGHVMRPASYLVSLFFGSLGYRCIRLIITLIIILAIYPFFHEFILLPQLSVELWWFLPIIVVGSIIGFLIAALVGILAFWTTQAEWGKHAWWMVSSFAAGYIAPIAFYPEIVQRVLSLTPFPLLMQIPSALILGQLESNLAWRALILGIVWMVILGLTVWILWHRGLRRLDGVGL